MPGGLPNAWWLAGGLVACRGPGGLSGHGLPGHTKVFSIM